MTEALKCPECSAPLDPPAEGSRTMRCPYCHSNVILKDAYSAAAINVQSGIGMAIGNALELAQINQHLRAGNKIEAIKIYRQCYRVDLATAKMAVDKIAAGQRVNPSVASAGIKPAAQGARLGLVFGIFGLVVAALIAIGSIVRVVNTSVPNLQPAYVPPVFNDHPAPPIPVAPPPPPAFANQVMEFGSKGIGAGQFKDARSIGVDGSGHIFVGEYGGGRIQVFDSTGNFLRTWTIDSKDYLMNLAVSRDGTLLAVMGGKILCFEGMTGREFGEAARINGDDQENYMDACFALTGDIYAIDTDSNFIILDGTGQIKRTIKAKQNTGDDEVSFDKIAVNGAGQIYAIDNKKGVFQFAPDGRYINRFGKSEDDDPTDRRPDTLQSGGFNLAIDGQGRIFVGDVAPAIKVYDKSGRFLDSIGVNEVCFGVAITDQNEILGCFRNDYAVKKFVLAKN
jgi:DNA-directed RNA polymerase subunit RPC12/RpoP